MENNKKVYIFAIVAIIISCLGICYNLISSKYDKIMVAKINTNNVL